MSTSHYNRIFYYIISIIRYPFLIHINTRYTFMRVKLNFRTDTPIELTEKTKKKILKLTHVSIRVNYTILYYPNLTPKWQYDTTSTRALLPSIYITFLRLHSYKSPQFSSTQSQLYSARSCSHSCPSSCSSHSYSM